jgi:ParB family chromosome partitioning protein
VADRLAERFETRVRVDASGKGRGKVIIEFAGLEDLQRIVDVIDGPTSG